MGVRLWRCSSCSLPRDSSWVARTTSSRTIWASNCCTFRRRAARRVLLRASRVCRRGAGRPLRHAGVAPSLRGMRSSATTFAQRTRDAWQCHPFRATDAGCVAVPPFSRVMQQMLGSATLFARGGGTLQNVQRQLHGVQRFARLQRSIVNALEEVSFRHQPKRTQVFGGHSPLSAIGSTPKKTLALSLLVWHLSAARDPENSGSWVFCFLREHRGNSEVTSVIQSLWQTAQRVSSS